MKQVEIRAYGFWDAVRIAKEEYGVKAWRNATRAWKKAGAPFTSKPFKLFCIDTMQGYEMDDLEGVGFFIILNNGMRDRRKYPVTFKQHERKAVGRRKKLRFYEIRRKDNDELIGVGRNLKEAKKIARQNIKLQQVDLYCELVYRIEGMDGLIFEALFTPDKRSNLGTYLLVYNELKLED